MDNIVVKDTVQFRQALTSELARLSDAKVMTRLGFKLKQRITDRTVKEHKGSDGSGFPRYSTKPIYVSKAARPAPSGGVLTPRSVHGGGEWFSAKTGKSVKAPKKSSGKTMYFQGGYEQRKAALYGPARNLTLTGKMFEALTYEAKDKSVLLFFNEVANANAKAAGNDERTPFFGVGKFAEEQAAVLRDWEDAVNGV